MSWEHLPDGKFVLKNSFENFHKEFYVYEFGTDKIIRTVKQNRVNYHKWPNAKDGQNYVLFQTFRSLSMCDVTTGDKWIIRDVKERSDVIHGFDYVSQPLAQVLAGSRSSKPAAELSETILSDIPRQ